MTRSIAGLVVVLLLALPVRAQAQRRWGFSFESQVVQPSALELRLWSTPNLIRDVPYARYEERLELVYGISSRVQASFYANVAFERTTSPSIALAVPYGATTQWRFVLLDAADDAVGLALDAQVTGGSRNLVGEARLILDKRAGPLWAVLNLGGSYGWVVPTWTRAQELEQSLGIGYRVLDGFGFGLEARHRMLFEDSFRGSGLYVGPTASYANGRWWGLLAATAQVAGVQARDQEPALLQTRGMERYVIRLLVGVKL